MTPWLCLQSWRASPEIFTGSLEWYFSFFCDFMGSSSLSPTHYPSFFFFLSSFFSFLSSFFCFFLPLSSPSLLSSIFLSLMLFLFLFSPFLSPSLLHFSLLSPFFPIFLHFTNILWHVLPTLQCGRHEIMEDETWIFLGLLPVYCGRWTVWLQYGITNNSEWPAHSIMHK